MPDCSRLPEVGIMLRIFKKFAPIFSLAIAFVISFSLAANAQFSVPSEGGILQQCSVPESLETVRVLPQRNQSRVVLGDRIAVQVQGLSEAINNNDTTTFNPRQLVLYLNGYALKDNFANPIIVTNGDKIERDWLAFQLQRTEQSEEAWQAVIGNIFTRSAQVLVGVGCPEGQAIPTATSETLPTLNISLWSWRAYFCLGIFLFLTYVFLRYCRDSVRSIGDEGVVYDNGLLEKRPLAVMPSKFPGISTLLLGEQYANKNPFSMTLVQLGLWTGLIVFSFLLIYGITGNFNNILTGQAVILLGINIATAVGTAIIDGRNGQENRKGSLRVSQGLIPDILSDATGTIQFQRFQTFIWTLVLALIFIWQVFITLKMPEFDETLLALAGVNAATYLSLRGQEVQGNSEPYSPGQ